jgi:hypothetical protein
MAGIDKTYTNSYKDYREFKIWADSQKLTFFDGLTVCIGDWVWVYEEKDFSNGEIPIMNTPTWLDIYLIQNCKNDFVLERMKNVYNEESFEQFKTIDLTAKPKEDFKQNRVIKITRDKHTKFPLHRKPLDGKSKWWLQCEGDFLYNDETNIWVNYDTPYPNNTNTAHLTSVKSVIKHLKKQYLPKGLTFRLLGRYVGENYLVTVK